MKFAFVDAKRMRATTKIVIDQANSIVAEMAIAGYKLTLRQLYYQFVSRGWLENKQLNYQRLGGIVDEGRKQGYIDWDAIEDRTRSLRGGGGFEDAGSFIVEVIDAFSLDVWKDQRAYVEVWVEKDALLGVIERPAAELRVGYFACRGYASSSALYDAGRRIRRAVRLGKEVHVFHLGDHDPSGIDMSRANRDAIAMFAQTEDFELHRIALNMDQVEEHNPPPNPAKDTDSRFEGYRAEFGEECWELDALPPAVIDTLIRENIETVIERRKFDEAMLEEDRQREGLRKVADNFDDVLSGLDNDDPEDE